MKKRVLAILLVLCMTVLACTPAVTMEEPVVTEAPVVTEPPAEPDSGDTPLPERQDGCYLLSIYWTAGSINFDTTDVWLWFEGKDGRGYEFVPCNYGARCTVNVPTDVTTVGFIVRRDCTEPFGTSWGSATKDVESDRFVETDGKDTAIYLKSGDEAIYYSEDGGVTLYQKLELSFAGIVATNQIKYQIQPATRLTDISQVKVYCGGQEVPVKSVSSLNNEVIVGTVTVEGTLDITTTCEIEIEGYGRKVAMPTEIFDSTAFVAQYVYEGDDLGATLLEDGKTQFKVWAPTASRVVLNLFEAGNGGSAFASVDMERGDKGVWSLTYDCGHGTYYTYSVTTAIGTQEAVDPYAKAVGVNGKRGMVIDLDSTDPEGFAGETFDPGLSSYQDAIIWEVHVRDFSNTIAGSKYPGKYLAFTETGLTNSSGVPVGVDYLRELGVTHVHFQPIYDYHTVDETKLDTPQFNWGYDPENYNAPEGSYSTDPYHGEVRVNELKQMVQSLHSNGLAVVMDVVYNHTFDGNSNLNKIVPYYYYRYNAAGENSNGSGCGNETASDRLMFRKYMVDSIVYWMTEYHIDGFRFDLMALHDVDTMQAIETAVHAINPQIILYGEGWTGGTSALNSNKQASQANYHKIKATGDGIGSVAVFNDAIRDGLKGSVWDAVAKGYINEAPTKANANKVLFGMSGGALKVGASWKVNDAMIVNYMSSHDNRTLWDILKLASPNASEDELCAENRLGASLVLFSKGIPFWLAGEEMLRTKQGNENSYNASDAINNIDWEALTPDSNAYKMVQFYRDLIKVRKANPWLYQSDVTGEVLDQNAIAVYYANGDKTIGFLAANPTDAPITVTLPAGNWTGVWNAEGNLAGTVEVPPMSVVLLKAK